MTLIRPITEQEQKIANIQYGKNMEDLSISQRVDIRKRISSGKVDTITFEQYLEDYKGMANDPDYKPKYIKPNVGTGMSPQQLRAKAEARKTIEGFDSKFNKNISRRKRIKMKAAIEADPERKQREMAKKAERRRKRRSEKLEGKKTLTPREKLLNFEQSFITRQLNDKIKANPNIILKNKELMDKLSTTVDNQGNIIKSKPTIYELEKRGLFEIEHQRDVRKKGGLKDFPYNRNLILGPFNRSGGFKDMAEKFIEKNPDPNNPKVKNIIKKAEELKITLQPEVPKGTFKTKGVGYKQPANPTVKFVDYAKSTLPELVDDKIGLKGYTGDIKQLEKGLGFAKGAMPKDIFEESTTSKVLNVTKKLPKKLAVPLIGTAAVMDILTDEVKAEPNIIYNPEIGAVVNKETDQKVPQSTILDWAANNPIATTAIASTPLLNKSVRSSTKKLLGGLLKTLGTPGVAGGFALGTIKSNLDEGKGIAESVLDPMVGIELLAPDVYKKFGGKGLTGLAGKILNLTPRIAGAMTPVGLGITAVGLGKMGYDAIQKDVQRMKDEGTYKDFLEEQAEFGEMVEGA